MIGDTQYNRCHERQSTNIAITNAKKKHKQNEREVKQTKTFQKEKKCYCKNVTIDICQSMFKILHF